MNTDMDSKIVFRGGEDSDFIAKFLVKSFVALIILLLYSIFAIYKYGTSTQNFIILGGALLSFLSYAGFVLLITLTAAKGKKRGIFRFLLVVVGFIPYIYSLYIIFIEGFWRLKSLLEQFSWVTIIASIVFILLGSAILSGIYKLTEFLKLILSGKVIIE